LDDSSKKIEAIFDILESLDGLDKAAWMELINVAEAKRNEELQKLANESADGGQVILNMILPLMKLIRLTLASKEISQLSRIMIVKVLIQELTSLLNPVETAGILWSITLSSFEDSRSKMPMPIIVSMGPLGIRQDEEDKSRTVV